MTVLLATDRIGQRIVDGLLQIRTGYIEASSRQAAAELVSSCRARTMLLATSRPGSAAVAQVAADCSQQGVPLLMVSLDPAELQVGPVYGLNGGECFQCHRTRSDLDLFYDTHPVTAPDGYLPQHIGLAVHIALAMLDDLASGHGTVPASARLTRVVRMLDNSLVALPIHPGPCSHDPLSDHGRG